MRWEHGGCRYLSLWDLSLTSCLNKALSASSASRPPIAHASQQRLSRVYKQVSAFYTHLKASTRYRTSRGTERQRKLRGHAGDRTSTVRPSRQVKVEILETKVLRNCITQEDEMCREWSDLRDDVTPVPQEGTCEASNIVAWEEIREAQRGMHCGNARASMTCGSSSHDLIAGVRTL